MQFMLPTRMTAAPIAPAAWLEAFGESALSRCLRSTNVMTPPRVRSVTDVNEERYTSSGLPV